MKRLLKGAALIVAVEALRHWKAVLLATAVISVLVLVLNWLMYVLWRIFDVLSRF
jgi:hypothetical protein